MAKKSIWQKGYRIERGSTGKYRIVNKRGALKSEILFDKYYFYHGNCYVYVGGYWHTLSEDGKSLKTFANITEVGGIAFIKNSNGLYTSLDDKLRDVKDISSSKEGILCKNKKGDLISFNRNGEVTVEYRAEAEIEHLTNENNENIVKVGNRLLNYDTKFDLARGYSLYYGKDDGFTMISPYGDFIRMHALPIYPEQITISSDKKHILFNDRYHQCVALPIVELENNAKEGVYSSTLEDVAIVKKVKSKETGYTLTGYTPTDYINGNFVAKNPDGTLSVIAEDGKVTAKDITSYQACGDGIIYGQDKYGSGKEYKTFSINGVDREVEDVKDLGYGYYAVSDWRGGYYIVDKKGEYVDTWNHNFEDIESAHVDNGIVNLVVTSKLGEDKFAKQIVSIYKDEDEKTHTYLSGHYEEILHTNTNDYSGFICNVGAFASESVFDTTEKPYHWLSPSLDKSGIISTNKSDGYKYMEKDELTGNIYVQTEENGLYHEAIIQDNGDFELGENEKTSIKVLGKWDYEYRDTLGRTDKKQKESSNQFAKYHNGEIQLQDLDERCFGDPVFTGAVLQTEKQRMRQLIEQAQTEQEVADLLKQAEQIKQQVFMKEQSLLESQQQQEKLNQAKAEAMDSLDGIL